MQETCGGSKSHENAKNFEVIPGKSPSFADIGSLSSLVPCELRRPPGRMKSQIGPFRIEPKEGKKEYKSPGT